MLTKTAIFFYRMNWINKLFVWSRRRPQRSLSFRKKIFEIPNLVFRAICLKLAKLFTRQYKYLECKYSHSHLGGHFGHTHIDEGALIYLKEKFSIESMIDIGCGPGGQVEIARTLGIEAFGIDGDSTIKFNKPYFFLHDFTQGKAPINRTFDLAWSVEFLEHVEEKFQPFYMDLFTKAKIIVCTAAFPGQGGYHHVNEKNTEYWIGVFKKYKLQYNGQIIEELKQHSTMRSVCFKTGIAFVNTRMIGKS